tara:strand:+ start:334 stop:1197 length:864 start_codon:yes stop_codon:yes gene_type:complete
VKLFFLLVPIILSSQSLKVNSSLDTTVAFIGDIINWTISVEGRGEGQIIRFPELDNKKDNVITIAKKKSEKLQNVSDHIYFEITIWDTGTFFTPDYFIEVLDGEGNIDFTLETTPLQISISSILSSLNENQFRPVKEPVPVKDIIPLRKISLVILLILVCLGIVVLLRKREKFVYKKVNYQTLETPYNKAMRRLNELDESSMTKEYYTELSHISREYIETKYFIRVLEMTTFEIEKYRIFFPIDDSHFENWLKFLKEADRVKYAKEIPKVDKLLSSKEMIFNLIDEL